MFYGRHAGRFHGQGVGLLWPILLLVLFAGMVAVVVYGVVHLSSHRRPLPAGSTGPRFGPGYGPDAAIEQVRSRYARGEISRDEYFRLVGDLSWGRGPGPGPGGPPPPGPPGPPAPPAPPPATGGPPHPPGSPGLFPDPPSAPG